MSGHDGVRVSSTYVKLMYYYCRTKNLVVVVVVSIYLYIYDIMYAYDTSCHVQKSCKIFEISIANRLVESQLKISNVHTDYDNIIIIIIIVVVVVVVTRPGLLRKSNGHERGYGLPTNI